MIDFIDELYRAYCENNEDIFASDVDTVLKSNREQIVKALSRDLADKFSEIQIVDSERAFRCGFSVALKLVMQGVAV